MYFPVTSNSFINIFYKFALVRERKVNWENLFDGTGTKQGVPIKIKEQLMSNDVFIWHILLTDLATRLLIDLAT